MLRGLLIMALAGCGYTSEYVAPPDGRARPLWFENGLTNNLAQLPMPPGCVAQGAVRESNQGFVEGIDLRTLELAALFPVWPVLAVVMAIIRPEATDTSAAAIDEVNAYNDLARLTRALCRSGLR